MVERFWVLQAGGRRPVPEDISGGWPDSYRRKTLNSWLASSMIESNFCRSHQSEFDTVRHEVDSPNSAGGQNNSESTRNRGVDQSRGARLRSFEYSAQILHFAPFGKSAMQRIEPRYFASVPRRQQNAASSVAASNNAKSCRVFCGRSGCGSALYLDQDDLQRFSALRAPSGFPVILGDCNQIDHAARFSAAPASELNEVPARPRPIRNGLSNRNLSHDPRPIAK
jgi:hypothetical protein